MKIFLCASMCLYPEGHYVRDLFLNFGRVADVGFITVIYTSKKRMSSSLNLHVLEAVDSVELTMHPTRAPDSRVAKSFRPCGGVRIQLYSHSPNSFISASLARFHP